MKNRIAFYYAYDVDCFGEKGRWRGTATRETINKQKLTADWWYPLHEDESVAVDGWAFKAP
jgi:hypothetical protein